MANARVGSFCSNDPVSAIERVRWARRRLSDARRLLDAHPTDASYQASYDARLAELDAARRLLPAGTEC
jgi:hypothetical protein